MTDELETGVCPSPDDATAATAKAPAATAARRCGARWPWVLGIVMFACGLAGLDAWVLQNVSRRFATPNPIDRDWYVATIWFWDTVRWFGSATGALAAYFAIIALHAKGLKAANTGLLAILSADGVGLCLKFAVGRVRPNQAASHMHFLRPFEALWSDVPVSFPSGEATAAFALATVLAILFPRSRWLVYGLAVLTAVARILAGAHYVADIAAGALIGSALSRMVFTWLTQRNWPLLLGSDRDQ